MVVDHSMGTFRNVALTEETVLLQLQPFSLHQSSLIWYYPLLLPTEVQHHRICLNTLVTVHLPGLQLLNLMRVDLKDVGADADFQLVISYSSFYVLMVSLFSYHLA